MMQHRFVPSQLSLNFFAIFLVIGIYVPFLPVWMTGRGLSNVEIGMIFAVGYWSKAPISLIFMSIADYTGRRKALLTGIALTVLAGLCALTQVSGFWAILVFWGLAGTMVTIMIPMSDSLSTIAIKQMSIDYGKVRRWGSISFIVATIGGGYYLAGRDSEHILYMLIAFAGLMAAGTLLLPNLKMPPRQTSRIAVLDLVKQPNFLLFVGAASCIQASHAALYGFATLEWTRAGIGNHVIGWLWAEGVLFEIILFTFSARILQKITPSKLLMIAGVAGICRWLVIGSTDWLLALIAAQALHALTFGGTHIAAINYIARNIPNDQIASAQGLYDGIAMGCLFGVVMLFAGWAYEDMGRSAFYLMSVSAALGTMGAFVLIKRSA